MTANHTISAMFAVNSDFHDHGERRGKWFDQSIGQRAGDQRRKPDVYDQRKHGICHIERDLDGVNQGAISTYTFSNVAANHTIAAAFTAYAGPTPVALYQFENNVLDTQGAYNGTAYNSPTYVTGKIGSKAIQFNGSNQYVTIPRPVPTASPSRSWVKTTQTSPTGSQWYNGNGMVDGEVGGVTNDFGVSYLNSKVAFGVGNGDTTIQSTSTINAALGCTWPARATAPPAR